MVNRTAPLLRYKEPTIRWINDPDEDAMVITGEHLNTDRTVYLISSDDGENGETLQAWIKQNFEHLIIDIVGTSLMDRV